MSHNRLNANPGEMPPGFWRELRRYVLRNLVLFIMCGTMALIGMMARAYWLVLVAWLLWMVTTYRTGRAFSRDVRS
jgi:hypothetical protein